MLDDERLGISIITVPAQRGPYAVWCGALNTIVVAANTADEQIAAILRLVDELLEASASRDRTPSRSE